MTDRRLAAIAVVIVDTSGVVVPPESRGCYPVGVSHLGRVEV